MSTESIFDLIRAAQQQAAFAAAAKAEQKQAEPAKQQLIGICIFCNKWMYNNPKEPFKMEAIAIPIAARASTFTFACISCARERRLIN